MAVSLNAAGDAHARSLINAGNYDDTAPWSFSAEDGDKLLGATGDDWTAYSSFHLGEDTAEAQDTKARFKYPYGKDGKVYTAALRAIRQRASQQGVTAIFDAAGRLMDLIDTKEGETGGEMGGEGMSSLGRRQIANRAPSSSPAGYRVVRNASQDSAEIYLYGMIGDGGFFGDGISAKQFSDDLKSLGKVKTVNLRINSEGGDVFDGKAIYTLLQNNPATVVAWIDGLAASAASFIAMAANEINIAEGAFMMVHNASGFVFGNSKSMRQTADLLDTVDATLAEVYAARTRKPIDQVRQMMADETWMTGKDAIANGFADKLVPNMQVTASVRDPSKYRALPEALRPRRAAALAAIAAMKAAA